MLLSVNENLTIGIDQFGQFPFSGFGAMSPDEREELIGTAREEGVFGELGKLPYGFEQVCNDVDLLDYYDNPYVMATIKGMDVDTYVRYYNGVQDEYADVKDPIHYVMHPTRGVYVFANYSEHENLFPQGLSRNITDEFIERLRR